MKGRNNILKDIPEFERESLCDIWKFSEQSLTASLDEQIKEIFYTIKNRILRSKLTTLLTLLTTTISLTLLSLGLVFFLGTTRLLSLQTKNIQISIYIKDGTNLTTIEQLLEVAKSYPLIDSAKVISKTEALQNFTEIVGKNSPLIVGLDETKNPLPSSIELNLNEQVFDQALYERIINDFSASTHVESVKTYGGNLSDLSKIISLSRKISFYCCLALILVVAFLIASAVRLSVYSYQDEIEIMELVGASKWYIKLPFILEGALIGFVGALTALLSAGIFLSSLGNFLSSSNLLLLNNFAQYFYLTFFTSGITILIGVSFGALASLIATSKLTSFFIRH